MLVCIDKVTCVRMHRLIEFYWHERIEALEAERAETNDEQQDAFLARQVQWMRETRSAVVVSEERGEVARFQQWDLDITPHRKLMKEGMDLPPAMRKQPPFRNMQRMTLDDAFKAEQHPFRIAIVRAMWLTGFDVPSLSTLYLDKPLKAHTLMQAIARANRVHEGKHNGLILDYCGILKHLRAALATFAGGGDGNGGTNPARLDQELLDDLAEAVGLVRGFLDERATPLDPVIHQTGFPSHPRLPLERRHRPARRPVQRRGRPATCRRRLSAHLPRLSGAAVTRLWRWGGSPVDYPVIAPGQVIGRSSERIPPGVETRVL